MLERMGRAEACGVPEALDDHPRGQTPASAGGGLGEVGESLLAHRLVLEEGLPS